MAYRWLRSVRIAMLVLFILVPAVFILQTPEVFWVAAIPAVPAVAYYVSTASLAGREARATLWLVFADILFYGSILILDMVWL